MSHLSIDIGGTKIKSGLVQQNIVTEKNNFPTPQSLEEFSELLETIINSYSESHSFKIAFSVPGSVNESGTVFFGGALPYLNEVNLGQLIGNFDLTEDYQVSVENDAKAATLGEMTWGIYKMYPMEQRLF